MATAGLQAGSPARDILACPNDPITGVTLSLDARHYPRPQGASCDAGAYEAAGASPQTFVVTTGATDTGANDPACNTAANGGCTLRQAVNLSNLTTGAAANTITFDPGTNGQPLAVTSYISVSQSVTITGRGAANTQIAYTGSIYGVLTTFASAKLTLAGVTISGGAYGVFTRFSSTLAVADSAFTGGTNGIFLESNGVATVDRTLFSGLGNVGVHNFGGGAVTITNSTFTGPGIGVSNYSEGSIVVAGSTFVGSVRAVNNNSSGTLTVRGSILAGSPYQNCRSRSPMAARTSPTGAARRTPPALASFTREPRPVARPRRTVRRDEWRADCRAARR